jgi:hypothetical protein
VLPILVIKPIAIPYSILHHKYIAIPAAINTVKVLPILLPISQYYNTNNPAADPSPLDRMKPPPSTGIQKILSKNESHHSVDICGQNELRLTCEHL